MILELSGQSAKVTATKTIVETPAEANVSGTNLVGRTKLTIRNDSSDTRIRIGRLTTNLQRDGQVIEPGDTITLFPTTTIYACSEGAAIKTNISEN